MYQWVQNKRDHAQALYAHLSNAIEHYWSENVQTRVAGQKSYADVYYSWQYRQQQWESTLRSIALSKGIDVNKALEEAVA